MRSAYVPDEPVLYGRLTPLEYLVFVGGLWKMAPAAACARAQKLLELLDLDAKRDVYCEDLSKGMRQKFGLAAGLIHDPDLLIVDEPLTALDSLAARQVKDLLVARTRQGKVMLLTSHILEVTERLADRIGILRAGPWLPKAGSRNFSNRAAPTLRSRKSSSAWSARRCHADRPRFLALAGSGTAPPASACSYSR
jgi:ABC-2 type transport system ATP-binding protein